MKRLLTYKGIAEEYGPNIWFWRTQVWRGNLKHCGTDNRHLFDRNDIEELIESNKNQ